MDDFGSLTFSMSTWAVMQEMKRPDITETRLKLLSNITGSFRPGVLTALVGVSGAGKTTLMDVLAGRKTGGYIEGDIRISGYPKNQATFSRIAGYCEQNDIHSPQMTVHESLIYSAWLRLLPEVPDHEKSVWHTQRQTWDMMMMMMFFLLNFFLQKYLVWFEALKIDFRVRSLKRGWELEYGELEETLNNQVLHIGGN